MRIGRRLLPVVVLLVVWVLGLAGPAGARGRVPESRLVGLVLASGQALVWDGRVKQYRLLKVGDRFHGARVLGLGVDRVLAERRGAKFIWKLGAPARASGPGHRPRRAASGADHFSGGAAASKGLAVSPGSLGAGPSARASSG